MTSCMVTVNDCTAALFLFIYFTFDVKVAAATGQLQNSEILSAGRTTTRICLDDTVQNAVPAVQSWNPATWEEDTPNRKISE